MSLLMHGRGSLDKRKVKTGVTAASGQPSVLSYLFQQQSVQSTSYNILEAVDAHARY